MCPVNTVGKGVLSRVITCDFVGWIVSCVPSGLQDGTINIAISIRSSKALELIKILYPGCSVFTTTYKKNNINWIKSGMRYKVMHGLHQNDETLQAFVPPGIFHMNWLGFGYASMRVEYHPLFGDVQPVMFDCCGNALDASRIQSPFRGRVRCVIDFYGNALDVSRIQSPFRGRVSCVIDCCGNALDVSRIQSPFRGRVSCVIDCCGNALDASRTRNLLLRKQVLYPLSYEGEP
jgi:hypothetical protein